MQSVNIDLSIWMDIYTKVYTIETILSVDFIVYNLRREA